jgi:hypothetical protein
MAVVNLLPIAVASLFASKNNNKDTSQCAFVVGAGAIGGYFGGRLCRPGKM